MDVRGKKNTGGRAAFHTGTFCSSRWRGKLLPIPAESGKERDDIIMRWSQAQKTRGREQSRDARETETQDSASGAFSSDVDRRCGSQMNVTSRRLGKKQNRIKNGCSRESRWESGKTMSDFMGCCERWSQINMWYFLMESIFGPCNSGLPDSVWVPSGCLPAGCTDSGRCSFSPDCDRGSCKWSRFSFQSNPWRHRGPVSLWNLVVMMAMWQRIGIASYWCGIPCIWTNQTDKNRTLIVTWLWLRTTCIGFLFHMSKEPKGYSSEGLYPSFT